MPTKKKIEVFTAGCSTCKETIELVKRIAGSSHEVVIHDMHRSETTSKAKNYGVAVSLLSSLTVNSQGAALATAQTSMSYGPRYSRAFQHGDLFWAGDSYGSKDTLGQGLRYEDTGRRQLVPSAPGNFSGLDRQRRRRTFRIGHRCWSWRIHSRRRSLGARLPEHHSS